MKTFLVMFLISLPLKAGEVLKKSEPLSNTMKISSSFEKNDALFLLTRDEMETLRMAQLGCKNTEKLYEHCKSQAEPNPFLTTKFLLGSVIVSLGIGSVLGFLVSR